MATPEYLWSILRAHCVGPSVSSATRKTVLGLLTLTMIHGGSHNVLNNSRHKNYKCNRLKMDESWKSIKMLPVSTQLRSGKSVQEFPEL